MGKLYKVIKGNPKPNSIIQAVEFNKLALIVDFVGFKNQLKYDNFKDLVEFVKKDLINS